MEFVLFANGLNGKGAPLARASERNASRNSNLGRPLRSIVRSVKITASHARTAPRDRHVLNMTILGPALSQVIQTGILFLLVGQPKVPFVSILG